MQRTLDSESDQVGLAFNASRPKSATSWGAIFAGALVAASVSLILVALGSGLGFAAMSPWPGQGASAGVFSVAAVIWLIVMQWIASLFGGYITGRLRTRWIGTHVHEVFFRDTANGLVTWALSTLVVATVLASAVASGISGGVKAASSVAAAGAAGTAHAAVTSESGSDMGYGIDKLFRTTGSTPTASSADARGEVTRILLNAASNGSLSDADRTYLVSLVAARSGISDADAQHRVDELVASANEAQTKAKAAADAARKDAAEVSIYTALALLIGAFIASVSAALGGRLRDEHV
jgi:hypothetical protein